MDCASGRYFQRVYSKRAFVLHVRRSRGGLFCHPYGYPLERGFAAVTKLITRCRLTQSHVFFMGDGCLSSPSLRRFVCTDMLTFSVVFIDTYGTRPFCWRFRALGCLTCLAALLLDCAFSRALCCIFGPTPRGSICDSRAY